MVYPERIVPDETGPGILAIHLKRYDFARPLCAGGDVLDAACGAGYGTAHLAEVAEQVVGVDLSEEAIAYARGRYAAPNVEFRVDDLLARTSRTRRSTSSARSRRSSISPTRRRSSAMSSASFAPTERLFVSTPQARVTNRSPENPFHAVEFSRADFESVARRFFGDVEVYGQRRLQTARHRLMQRLDVLGLRKRLDFLRPASVVLGTQPMAEVTANGLAIDRKDLDGSAELVAVCRAPRRE